MFCFGKSITSLCNGHQLVLICFNLVLEFSLPGDFFACVSHGFWLAWFFCGFNFSMALFFCAGFALLIRKCNIRTGTSRRFAWLCTYKELETSHYIFMVWAKSIFTGPQHLVKSNNFWNIFSDLALNGSCSCGGDGGSCSACGWGRASWRTSRPRSPPSCAWSLLGIYGTRWCFEQVQFIRRWHSRSHALRCWMEPLRCHEFQQLARAAERKPCCGMVSHQFPFPAQGEVHGNLWQFIRFIPSDQSEPSPDRSSAGCHKGLQHPHGKISGAWWRSSLPNPICALQGFQPCMQGVEMASVHLPPNTLCVRFKEIPWGSDIEKINPCIEKNQVQYYWKSSGSEAWNSIPWSILILVWYWFGIDPDIGLILIAISIWYWSGNGLAWSIFDLEFTAQKEFSSDFTASSQRKTSFTASSQRVYSAKLVLQRVHSEFTAQN